MSDEPNPFFNRELATAFVEAQIRQAAALESIAMQMPALIEKMGSRGGGNWKGKKGNDLGTFKNLPNLATIPENDTFKLPAMFYQYQKNSERIIFFGPFDRFGERMPDNKIGTEVGSIKVTGKSWENIFKDWKYNPDGAAHSFPLRLITLKVGVDKEDKTKKYKFIDGVTDPGVTDPLQIEYTDPPTGAKNDGNGDASAQQ